MSIGIKIRNRLNSIVRKSYWFNQIAFSDCQKFWDHDEYNLDLVNLGSSSAKFGFDYSDIDLRTANWAMAPQTFVGDRAILANYLSFLKPEKAVVILTICPFTCLDDGKSYLPDKIYTVVDMLSIPDFAFERKMSIYDVKKNPIKYYPVYRILPEIKHLFIKQRSRTMNSKQLEEDAVQWIESWKKQFSIYELSYDFSILNKDRFALSVKAYDKLLDECFVHQFTPVVVLPPVSNALLKYFDTAFQQQYIYDYLKSSKYKDVRFMNYLGDAEFREDNLYRNANFLNSKGAKLFTKRVIDDLNKVGIVHN